MSNQKATLFFVVFVLVVVFGSIFVGFFGLVGVFIVGG